MSICARDLKDNFWEFLAYESASSIWASKSYQKRAGPEGKIEIFSERSVLCLTLGQDHHIYRVSDVTGFLGTVLNKELKKEVLLFL